MSMDRLPSSGARNTYVDQADQRTDNLTDEQEREGQARRPVMRQRQTGRENLEDEKNEDQPSGASLLNQHSKPHLSSRSTTDQESFQLDPIDQEKFAYTKKQFFDAVDKQDVKAVVKMLRHGKNLDADNLTNGEIWRVVDICIEKNLPELLSEMIRESRMFDGVAVPIFTYDDFFDSFEKRIDFVKAMDNRRALPKDIKNKLFSAWLRIATQSGNSDNVEAVIRLESSFFADTAEGDRGYRDALECALVEKNNLHELLLKNMFTGQSQVKIGISTKTCSYAAGLAVATSHPDWAIQLQDGRLNMEKVAGIDDPNFQNSLGHKLNTDNKKHFIDDFLAIFKERSKGGDQRLGKVVELYEHRSNYDYSDDFYLISNILIMECVRPDVAEALADLISKCIAATEHEESLTSSEDSDEESNEISRENSEHLRLKALIASQLDSSLIKNEEADVTTALQVSELSQVGKIFFDNLLSDIPKLIDNCFDLMDSELELQSDDVQKLLIDKFAFPKSLAEFLAVSMSKLVKQCANKPGMVLPKPMSFLEMSKYTKRCVKESACQAFKNTFSEIIKQQQLMTLFNKDAKGREDLWINYFYAYLDALKAALPSPKTEH